MEDGNMKEEVIGYGKGGRARGRSEDYEVFDRSVLRILCSDPGKKAERRRRVANLTNCMCAILTGYSYPYKQGRRRRTLNTCILQRRRQLPRQT